MFKKILITLVVLVGAVFAYASTRPDTYRVERSTKIDAPAAVVFSQLDNFKSWSEWSPWDKLDATMKKTFAGPPAGVGSSYAWKGNNKVGEGKMTITDSSPPSEIKYRLEFIKPFEAVATTTFTLKPEGDNAVTTFWAMDGKNNLMGKVLGLFMNMDQSIGADFEKGLADLKTVSEREAKKRAAAEAEAKAKAEADAAAKAKADAEAAAAATAAAEAEAAAKKPKGKGKKK
jgi:uncharacterized protein YndB with AHSA1/START domain